MSLLRPLQEAGSVSGTSNLNLLGFGLISSNKTCRKNGGVCDIGRLILTDKLMQVAMDVFDVRLSRLVVRYVFYS